MTSGREAAGWGAIGALSFLVLALGFQLATTTTIDLHILIGVAAVVGAVAGFASQRMGGRIR